MNRMNLQRKFRLLRREFVCSIDGFAVGKMVERKGGIVLQDFLKRFKSWALWLSLASLAAFCVKHCAGIDIGEFMNGFLDVLLPVLVGFGVVNNPTDSKGL